MSRKNRKQVWLIVQPCHAVQYNHPHDGHIYFKVWKSVDTADAVAACNQRCYYYCNGLTEAAP